MSHVFLKVGYPIPSSRTKWKLHKKEEPKTREDAFLDRQSWFRALIDIEGGEQPPKIELNEVILICLDGEDEEEEEIKGEKAISLEMIWHVFWLKIYRHILYGR